MTTNERLEFCRVNKNLYLRSIVHSSFEERKSKNASLEALRFLLFIADWVERGVERYIGLKPKTRCMDFWKSVKFAS